MSVIKLGGVWLAGVILLSGCVTSGSVTDGCVWVSPIFISEDDALTKGTADQILILNEAWDSFCD